MSADPIRVAAAHIPASLDHLVLAVPDLAAGTAEIEVALGVRAIPGGSHPGRGTANALVPMIPTGWPADSLTYLEILGPDPEQDPALTAQTFAQVTRPDMQRWAVRPDDFDATVARAAETGADLGGVFDMTRTAPDGTTLEWRLTRRAPLAHAGAQPFLIDWGTTPQPALALAEAVSGGAAALTLAGLGFASPDPRVLARDLAVLGVDAEVHESPVAGFAAELRGPAGTLTLMTPELRALA